MTQNGKTMLEINVIVAFSSIVCYRDTEKKCE